MYIAIVTTPLWHNLLSVNSYMLKGIGKGSPHLITERRVPELIPVLCSQPAEREKRQRLLLLLANRRRRRICRSHCSSADLCTGAVGKCCVV